MQIRFIIKELSSMAIISARVNDQSKADAEEIANKIGLSLSTVINIFLNKFIAEQGFPFSVTVPKKSTTVFEKNELEKLVVDAIKNNSSTPDLPKSAYVDPKDNIIKHTK